MKTILIIILVIIVSLVIIGGGFGAFVSNVDKGTEKINQNEKIQDIKEQITTKIDSKIDEISALGVCTGKALCITEKVTKIVDGDTIYTANHKIRLSLTNTPERNESGFTEATAFTAMHCPVNSMITVDQDDLQPYDNYDRMLGKVYCEGGVINEILLSNGYANILTSYCDTSEFSGESWAQKYGCKAETLIVTPVITPKETPKTSSDTQDCDLSYPDFCIPPYPPDLDCGEIPYKNFRVVGSDPHRFDGDKDGIGCES